MSQHGPIWPRFWTKLIAWLGLAALLLQPGCRLFQSTEPESNLRTTVAPDGLRPARDTSGRLRSGLSNESQEIEKNLGY